MALFPESSPTPNYPLVVTPVFKTGIVDLGAGGEQRRAAWAFPKYDVEVHYNALTPAEADTIWQFYHARKGAYEAFYIYDLSLVASVSFTHVGMYCGTGDGTTDTFDLPGRSTSSRTAYIDGAEEATATFLTGGGTESADRVEFVSAPPAGTIITADFTGHLRIRCRFAEDAMPREMFVRNLMRYGVIRLKGLKAA